MQLLMKWQHLLNRVMMLNHFRVPREALLNRTGDVNEEGAYVSPIKDKKKRLGIS